MRIHGSVTPRMILPLTMIGAWSTLITCLSYFVYELSVNTVLLTVLGFVVGLALSFRSSTAYERYSDGRKSWATLSVQSRNLARYIWVHISERPENAKEDLLSKVTAINLILAFAVSLKHKLRFEPYAHYPDIASLVGHLDTFAKSAHKEENLVEKKKNPWKVVGEYLGLSMASSNPRKAIKRADRPLGNLPLEILTYLSCYVEDVTVNNTLKSAVVQGQIRKSFLPHLYSLLEEIMLMKIEQ
jgi:putative membrane protein